MPSGAKRPAARLPGERNPVVLLCERMRDAAAEAEAGEAVNTRLTAYLGRAVAALENHGAAIAITDGQLDLGPWEQIFYGEFDGGRRKRVLIKLIGE